MAGEGEKGEGNYKASREFYDAQGEFVKDKDRVEDAARDAEEALDGPEGAELEAAEEEARSHAKE